MNDDNSTPFIIIALIGFLLIVCTIGVLTNDFYLRHKESAIYLECLELGKDLKQCKLLHKYFTDIVEGGSSE